jgi:hypothetical protein
MFIITAERNSKFVRTVKNKWAFFHPGVNENLWKFFRNKQEAEVAMLDIQVLPEVQNMKLSVVQYS